MSGIKVGTRLEQLLRLRDRIDLEIQVEIAVNPPKPANKPRRPPAREIKSRVIKQWAFEQGLIDHLPRGRVNPSLTEAYLAAHTRGDVSA